MAAINLLAATASGKINALTPNGKSVEFKLAANKKAFAVIVLPDSPSSQDLKAAEMLKKGLDSMSGACFDIIPESKYSVALKSKSILSIGNTKFKKNSYLKFPEVAPDGYRLQVSGNTIFFSGGKRRGPINAVIAFLEEDLGCRWYSSFVPAYYPHREKLTIKLVPRSFSPKLEMRDIYQVEAWNTNWAIMNRINSAVDPLSLKIPAEYGGMARYPGKHLFAHTFAKLAPSASLLSTHPEYFALMGKKRQTNNICLSNPETVKIVAQNAIKILDKDPTARFFSISQNDGASVLCRCKDCLALAKKENDSGLLMNFVNQVAKLINQKYPNVKISTLAYMQTFMPPKTIRPDKNILIWLATDSHVWHNRDFYITETKKFQNALKAWRKIGTEIHIWDYTFGDNANWLQPMPNFKVIDKNFKFLVKNDISGIFFQDNFISTGGSRATMKDWVLAKLAWNPSWKMGDLLRDFTFGYYGAAGSAMWKYNQLLNKQWETFHNSNKPDTGAVLHLDNTFIRKALSIIKEAKAAVINNPALLAEVEREETCLLYARLNSGLLNSTDKKSYLHDMDKFRKYIKRFKINSFSEFSGTDISTKFINWKIGMNLYGQQRKTPNVIDLRLDKVMLPKVGAATCRLVKDRSSNSGYAVYQPCSITHWSIQWGRSAINDYSKTKTYVLRLKIKLGELKHPGKVLHCGVWNNGSLLAREIDSSELSQKKFSWVTVGKVKLPPSSSWTIYVGPVENSAVEYFLLECAELIPKN